MDQIKSNDQNISEKDLSNSVKKQWVEPNMSELIIENIDPGPGFDGSGKKTS